MSSPETDSTITKPKPIGRNAGGKGGKPTLTGVSPKFVSESFQLKYEIESAIYGNSGCCSGSQDNLTSASVGSSAGSGPMRRSAIFRPSARQSFVNTKYTHHHHHQLYVFCAGSFRFLSTNPSILLESEQIDWSLVDIVLVPSATPPSCPICLEAPPRIPKVTRCGHVYCHLCLLRFFTLSSTSSNASSSAMNWRKCPICFEDFSFKEVKPAIHVAIEEPIGGWLQFVLRAKPDPGEAALLDDLKELSPFRRVTIINGKILREHLEEERRQLESSAKDYGEFDADLIRTALSYPLDPVEKSKEPTSDLKPIVPTANPTPIYFHQAADGQHLYLHPLCIKMLKDQFVSYAQFPASLHLQILEIDWLPVTEEVRRRFKPLGHLPLGTQIGLCEVDLGPILSPAILAKYGRELGGRARSRESRRRHEQERLDAYHREESDRISAQIEENWWSGTTGGLSTMYGRPYSMLTSSLIGADEDGLPMIQDYESFPPVRKDAEGSVGAGSSKAIPIPASSATTTANAAGSFASIAAGPSPRNSSSKKGSKFVLFNNDASRHRSIR